MTNDRPFRRPHYFTGRLLTAEDFRAEQDYHVGKRRLLNRALHGAGIVQGLEAALVGGDVRVEAGLALDCTGREIVVPEAVTIALPRAATERFLVLAYEEHGDDYAPVVSPRATEEARWIVEGYRLSWTEVDPLARHRAGSCLWKSCGAEHAITIARLRTSEGC